MVSAARVSALHYVVRHALEDLDGRGGWCRWVTRKDLPWEWEDHEQLVEAGLVEKKEVHRGARREVLLRPTAAGWTALSTAWGRK